MQVTMIFAALLHLSPKLWWNFYQKGIFLLNKISLNFWKYFKIFWSSENLHNMKVVGLEKLNNFYFGHFFHLNPRSTGNFVLQLDPWVSGKLQNQPPTILLPLFTGKQSAAAVGRRHGFLPWTRRAASAHAACSASRWCRPPALAASPQARSASARAACLRRGCPSPPGSRSRRRRWAGP